MANTVHLISKEYLNPNGVSDIIKKVAKNLNCTAGKSHNQKYDIIEINLFKDTVEGYLSISISCESDYNDTFNNLYGVSGYGMMIDVEYNYDNLMLIPFLRELLQEIPELLVYNEETPKDVDSYIYTKSHLDNFSGTDSYALLGNPPQNLT